MPEYTVIGILGHKGKTFREGDSIDLSEDVAEQLMANDVVVPKELSDPDKPLDEMTLKELKVVARKANVESYSTKSKAELYAILTGKAPEVEEQAVDNDADESDGSQ